MSKGRGGESSVETVTNIEKDDTVQTAQIPHPMTTAREDKDKDSANHKNACVSFSIKLVFETKGGIVLLIHSLNGQISAFISRSKISPARVVARGRRAG